MNDESDNIWPPESLRIETKTRDDASSWNVYRDSILGFFERKSSEFVDDQTFIGCMIEGKMLQPSEITWDPFSIDQ